MELSLKSSNLQICKFVSKVLLALESTQCGTGLTFNTLISLLQKRGQHGVNAIFQNSNSECFEAIASQINFSLLENLMKINGTIDEARLSHFYKRKGSLIICWINSV